MTGRVKSCRGTGLVEGTVVLALVCLLILCAVPAHAFWPFGGGGDGGSGLDLNKGYDVNTVTSIKGKVLSLNSDEGGGPILIEIRTGTGEVFLVAGPRWFWNDNGIPVQVGDEVSARGALTEGKDGRRYLLAQKLNNQRTGDEIILRSEDGVPAWSYLKRFPGQNRPSGATPGPKPGGRSGAGPRGGR
jgi:hypothetical protein